MGKRLRKRKEKIVGIQCACIDEDGGFQMVKLRDIAQQTGYSISTVSKALSGKGRMSDETRNNILSVARSLGYTPDFTQRVWPQKQKLLYSV